ncbi:MAG: histidine--tRNA ligase [Candidatus Omnitrophica bacterium]|nr:histidine--tRNA ligase [Candidatus Omnitrophota bacterium]
MPYKKIPGTKDILPDEALWWEKIELSARDIFRLYNYQPIRTPIIEEETLFNRSLGQTSEIVQKQMFLIKNKEDNYALRPEATVSVVRAYLENNIDKTSGFAKFYYMGPMFRFERPQKGRLRQFHHLGCEAIGSTDPSLDIETIALADDLLKAFSVFGYKIKINTLGCDKDKAMLAEFLRKRISEKKDLLCQDCSRRLETNVLRILDCKKTGCRQLVNTLQLEDFKICAECQTHFNRVSDGLNSIGIKYELSPYLVRGLDYYTRTVFEITHGELGAQDALGAGGRYDNLVKELGGPAQGAIGFAFGMERILLVAKLQDRQTPKNNLVYLIALGEEAKRGGIKILSELRKNNIACDTDYENKSLKGALRRANDIKASSVLILGEDELKRGIITVKNMLSGEQREVKREVLVEELRSQYAKNP